ncbi:glycosyltransferase [Acetobacteraceae bacterium KSS8]|uniref:Glycosyltransferase n=1 Tax=Endosaccharibacter trunci TaxID=2812733 RepID=A0ABT1W8H7_9PROT|nr:glycosyltransferase [Acetobacteraceae bacterium KSS8]
MGKKDRPDESAEAQSVRAQDRHLAIFTVCSNNYMPFARVLMESVRRWHPEASLFVCLSDEIVEWDGLYDGPFTVVEARTLSIPQFRRMSFQYDVMEFNTAVKPFMIDRLLEDGFGTVLYLDPDISVYAYLGAVLQPLRDGASLVLTPHLHEPAELDSDPSDITIMRSGIYNLGFLGVSNCAETRFIIRWWMRRLRHHCVNQQVDGLFVDQKFMDLVPGFAPAARILHDRTVNLAYWNLNQSHFGGSPGHWTVDGAPLSFFHFSGFDPKTPDRLSRHSKDFQPPQKSALASLLADYADRLMRAGYGTIPSALYAYGRFASGTVIPDHVRRMFRQTTPDWSDDPFETYEAYLHQAAPCGNRDNARLVMTNFMHYLWSFFNNQRYGLDPERADHLSYLSDWYVNLARTEQGFDHRLIAPVAERLGQRPFTDSSKARDHGAHRADLSVIGYLRTTSGVGAMARSMLTGLRHSSLTVEGVDVSFGVVSDRSDRSNERWLHENATGRVQLFANINADQLPAVLDHMAPRLTEPAYRIGMPAWELEEFPRAWLGAFDGVDEIWAQTGWIQRMLAARIDKPVIRMPVMLTVKPPPPLPRRYFGVPECRFLFFFAFDFLSFIERKNPEAAIAAFRTMMRSAHHAERAGLVIKIMNGHHAPEKHAAFLAAVADDPDIVVIDKVLSRDETLALVVAMDCVLSLHRCEGLGLVVAEAMALGVPVIATDYAATTELLSERTGYPVGFKLIPVKPGEYPFGEGQRWADADIDHAAWLMERVIRDPEDAQRRSAAAKRFIETHHGRDAVLRRQLARLAELGVH